MADWHDWDWDYGEKIVETASWKNKFTWVEEHQASPDGETIAAVVHLGEAGFGVCRNGRIWSEPFEKIWHLRFGPDGRAVALICQDGQWTVAVNGVPWENRFDFVWHPLVSDDGRHIAVAVQNDMRYAMTLDDRCWSGDFADMTYFAMSVDGTATAAAVQVKEADSGQVQKFQEGIFTAAINGKTWQTTFLNVWNLAISPDNRHVAAEVRLNLYDYTIAVDDRIWPKTFDCVWAPIFHPHSTAVVAPVRSGGKWTMFRDGDRLWDRSFDQLWLQCFNGDGSRLAAVAAPHFGCWTVVVDGIPWGCTFTDMVSDIRFSPMGDSVAALAKQAEGWTVVVDGHPWRHWFTRAWAPVFSPDGNLVAAAVELDGNYTVAVNDRIWEPIYDRVWDPCFSPDGERLMIRGLSQGAYHRSIISVEDVTT